MRAAVAVCGAVQALAGSRAADERAPPQIHNGAAAPSLAPPARRGQLCVPRLPGGESRLMYAATSASDAPAAASSSRSSAQSWAVIMAPAAGSAKRNRYLRVVGATKATGWLQLGHSANTKRGAGGRKQPGSTPSAAAHWTPAAACSPPAHALLEAARDGAARRVAYADDHEARHAARVAQRKLPRKRGAPVP
jgi:hypothetical protein